MNRFIPTELFANEGYELRLSVSFVLQVLQYAPVAKVAD